MGVELNGSNKNDKSLNKKYFSITPDVVEKMKEADINPEVS
ncbi:hypothetical protein CoNPh26_CDS0034 [Staphylococcus phage S-CoN_Ph26]|nr:hypothetical protein CoNPh26_CDS0034 [Staphylococcus phage S-CoN_Ph26]